MNILSAPDRDDVVPSWVGCDEDCSAVTELVRRSINARQVGLVCVVGDAGSGREALIDESMRRGRVDGVHVSGRGPLDLPSRSELECTARRAPVAVLPPLDGRDDKEIADLVNDIAALDKAIDLTLVVGKYLAMGRFMQVLGLDQACALHFDADGRLTRSA